MQRFHLFVSVFKITAEVGLTSAPVINAAGVFCREGWLFGAAASFDTASNKVCLLRYAVEIVAKILLAARLHFFGIWSSN